MGGTDMEKKDCYRTLNSLSADLRIILLINTINNMEDLMAKMLSRLNS
jgi:hypothetical protein